MSKWKGQTRGGLLGYKIFVQIIKNCDLSFVYFFLHFVVFYYFLTSRTSFKVIYQLYRHRLGNSTWRSMWLVYGNFYSLGQAVVDKIALLGGFSNKFSYNFDGENFLQQLIEYKQGGILIGAHVGNWQIAEYLLKRLDSKFNIVILDAEHKQIKQYLGSVLGEKKVNAIVIRDDFSHIIEIRNALRNNELICFHGDRYLEGSKTLGGSFLGQEAWFPSGPFYLAAKFRTPVSFFFAMKESKYHYHFFATRPRFIEAKTNLHDNVRTIVSEYISTLESIVRRYPAQWFNYYDFWKK